MNSSSTIEISKSSLLSLKAEILRKQQEVNKAKILQAQIQQTQTPLREKSRNNSLPEKQEPSNRGINERQARDEVEDEDMLQKSKKMLESKTKLYNKLAKGPRSLTEYEIEMNKHYLVQFDRKEKDDVKESSEEDHDSDDYEPASNADEEWVEYVDCLGRTRKCLRKDLKYLKEKDYELSKTLGPDGTKIIQEQPKWVIDTNGANSETNEEEKQSPIAEPSITENSELLSSDMRRELLRQEWEKQEQDLMNKKDIHYQDILFNEARSHGVGYYAFSKDDEERVKQQEELRKLRQETKEKQKSNLEQKSLREKQLAARLKAARNRRRARMGLPPEEDDPELPEPAPQVEENEDEKQIDAAKEAEEKSKEEARRKQVRPWDIGKEGVKKHYEYSQEEWVDKKRTERPKEFAPPTLYNPERKFQQKIYDGEDYTEPEKSLFFTTKKSKPPSLHIDTSLPPPNFTTTSRSINPYKNNCDIDEYNSYQTNFEPVPIVDECIDFDDEHREEISKPEKKSKRKGAEVAPPPTFEYFGPSTMKQNKTNDKPNLEDSIAAGLRFLREQAELKQKSAERSIERRNLDNT